MNPYVGATSFTFAMTLMDNKDEFGWNRNPIFWMSCLVLVSGTPILFWLLCFSAWSVDNMSSFQQVFAQKKLALWNLKSIFLLYNVNWKHEQVNLVEVQNLGRDSDFYAPIQKLSLNFNWMHENKISQYWLSHLLSLFDKMPVFKFKVFGNLDFGENKNWKPPNCNGQSRVT